ncbi:hypothetical protein KFK09_021280 [Dendrobium nobile]|uniref:Uncharacterized protein n=1 Tax=Dendrobium nobile TaxID=94219 RepID=A0A8T3ANU6_DENNO|nr:hypothetical protein KFK09_021280 [Dendrobium nobile]
MKISDLGFLALGSWRSRRLESCSFSRIEEQIVSLLFYSSSSGIQVGFEFFLQSSSNFLLSGYCKQQFTVLFPAVDSHLSAVCSPIWARFACELKYYLRVTCELEYFLSDFNQQKENS